MKNVDYFEYIDSSVIGRTSCNYIDDYIDQCLIYEWECDDEWYHAHDFRDVISYIIMTFGDADSSKLEFNFAPYIKQYSRQEMEIIEKLLDKLSQDKEELIKSESIKVVDSYKFP